MPRRVATRRRSSGTPTRIPIHSLSGGVSRQAPSKRLPTQAETLDNVQITLERSVEKRPGFFLLPQDTYYLGSGLITEDLDYSDSFKWNLFPLDIANKDYWFYWYIINEDNQFILVVDYAANDAAETLFYVFQVFNDGYWRNLTPALQWDPQDPRLPETYDPEEDDYNADAEVILAYAEDNSLTYAQALALGVVNFQSREYITFGSTTEHLGTIKKAKDALRAVSVGTNLILLNTFVKAGFSSGDSDWNGDNTGGMLFNLRGEETAEEDIKGRKITYWSAAKVTKVSGGWTPSSGIKYIPVEDYIYYDPSLPYLGQSLADFSEIRLPPDKEDWLKNNGNPDISDTLAAEMLEALYDPTHPYQGDNYEPEGAGKIYYCAGPYLSQPAGYYRIISFSESDGVYDPNGGDMIDGVSGKGRPYTQRVRTPDAYSYIDPARMPQKLTFNASPEGIDSDWVLQPIDWAPRTTGNRYSNPGPSVFLNADKSAPQHVQIKAITLYRNRLFLSAGNTLFSSQIGKYEDLWIQDPSNILDSDPIDVPASHNTYAEIISLVPFTDFLFINTTGNVQFELRGVNNQIGPTTSSLQPTTFYSTAPLVDPILMGSQIYFCDAERLYLYFSDKTKNINSALEVSSDVLGYLPENFRTAISAAAQDTIVMCDEDNPNTLYFYANRFSGDRVLQNAFYRYVLDDATEILSMWVIGNWLHTIVSRNSKVYLERTYLGQEDYEIPRLDQLHYLKIYSAEDSFYTNALWDSETNTTTITVPYTMGSEAVVILGSDYENDLEIFIPLSVTYPSENKTTLIIRGNAAMHGKSLWVGIPYDTTIELSKQFVRDENANSIDGTLSLRTLLVRHYNSGPYTVRALRRKTSEMITEFNPAIIGDATLSTEWIQPEGELVAKILGYSDTTQVFIESSHPTPLNIVQMEFKGKFKGNYNSFGN